ncbi:MULTISPECIES: TIGR02391 family protein [unclassified Agromyces]|uniref:TIGR02391 family protein n=1 Tax=unclassified Agromyces TaxID=2639701 RepID=UPI003014DA6E
MTTASESSEEVMITIAEVVSVSAHELRLMTASEAGLLILRAMHASKRPEWSVPNMRAHAEASVRMRARRLSNQRELPEAYLQLNLPQVLTDAFAWLISRALVGPACLNSGATGEYSLTAAGIAAAESGDSGRAEAAYRLQADLHPALEEARTLFERGSYQTAVFAATHQVEVRVRELSGAGPELYGDRLMRAAFNPESGRLATGDVKSEKEAIANLFAGTIGAFKNPASHRAVEFDDPTEAADIIHLADLMLRIAERSARTEAPEAEA